MQNINPNTPINKNTLGCIYNLIYIQYNELIQREEFFFFDLAYPVFYNVKNGYFQINKKILNNLNNTIFSSIETFRNGLYEEMVQYNKTAEENNLEKRTYQVNTTYDVAFNKNHILSLILNLNAFSTVDGPEYEDLYSYNIDLLNGNQLNLGDLFNPNVDYIKLISDYINGIIANSSNLFYPDTTIEIPESQAFYITDKGIIIYFALEEIADKSAGVPKFLISFKEFGQYIKPRFYCNAQNIYRKRRK